MSLYTFSLALLVAFVSAQSTTDLSQYVLTTTGTNGGNTFPGVSLPFGMVKLGPDIFSGHDTYSGDAPVGNFTGFSMMHESGTGGAPKYGVVSQMPVLGTVSNPLANLNDTRAQPDINSVGYYKASLGSKITVELSSTSRAGFYEYNFPTGDQANVVVDVSHVLPSYRGQGLSQQYLGGNISVSKNHYEGYGDYNNGWNRAPDWRIYFCGYFDSSATVKTFVGKNTNGSELAQYSTTTTAASTDRLGAVFSFSETNVTSRVGISFISTAQACDNVNTQIPSGSTLSTMTNNAKKIWNEDVLSKVTTTESNLSNLQLLYSSMYTMHLLPSNRTGENPLWKSSEPYYDDTFTTWDLFRCTFSLFQIFQPNMYEEYIRSLIDIFRFEGYMPDARSSNFNGATQGGSNSDNILADAFVKGVRGAVNWTTGYEAMVKDAEITPVNNNDPRDLSSSTKEGRGALPDWLKYGYITPKYGRAVTRAVEYSVNDFSLSQVAAGLGKTADATKYTTRSRNWRNHWNSAASALNFTGFLVPRNTSGFIAQNPLSCGGCYWGDAFYEALPWEYSFNAHHDINTLIALSGGPATFTSRLEITFTPGLNISGGSAASNNTIFNPGNEPSFTTPYLYNFVGRQDLSVKQSRNIAKSYYSPTPGGLPGNSDAGAMESWLLWNMLGLYPMVGQTTFLIGSPWFANTTISLPQGKNLAMTTTGGSNSSYYVQSLKVNGQPWTQSWLTWNDVFSKGGTMDFVLGPEPKNWDTGKAPPSPATEVAAMVSPKPAPQVEDHHRRKMLRDIGLAIMSLGLVSLIAATAAAIWWFRFKKQKPAATSEVADSEKGEQSMDEGKGNMDFAGSKRSNILLRWRAHILHRLGKRTPDTTARPTSKSDSLTTTSSSEDGQWNNGKKELSIQTERSLDPPPVEPWTPRGINRRDE
ncbi:putative secreted glycosidase [Lachnellula hyalina]|uniref:Putative secreted glycosidase n=1 Tax=Lachnellula hyalina TaxID=1316788 RepID=A0A8H8QVG8_9HELO|nr:putative secreted glycosidase [Lachnellula hyalina]TVY22440.1 putative secreted glycosidase [Lachnellula hyalina]